MPPVPQFYDDSDDNERDLAARRAMAQLHEQAGRRLEEARQRDEDNRGLHWLMNARKSHRFTFYIVSWKTDILPLFGSFRTSATCIHEHLH